MQLSRIEKFDFGNASAASGYTAVEAGTAYSNALGYGFANTSLVKNAAAAGKMNSAMPYSSQTHLQATHSTWICRTFFMKSRFQRLHLNTNVEE